MSLTLELPAVPEPGQVVEVRGSTWAVADVRAQGLPRSPADEAVPKITHVISLQSLHEDRLGEELDVVWELEVGHAVAADRGLPTSISADGVDEPSTLGAYVDAVRWGAVTSADATSYQAPFRSGANVEAYQLEPLRRALQSPRTNMLLADDVGLGKTIEAGLVVQELLLRHRARSVIVVCPPSLSLKWQDEMREKFGLDFVIVDSELMARVRRSHGLNANPFQLFPRVIVSMSWLPSLRAQRLLRDVYAQVRDARVAKRFAFDVLVVDEAHHVAPASPSAAGQGRGYAVDSQRTVATRDLAEKCEHRLFLSATPHNGHPESFLALLAMVDGRRFIRGGLLDTAALREVTVRRLKAELPGRDFQQRRIASIPFTPSESEQDAFSQLDAILTGSARANDRGRSGDIVSMLIRKRFLSSPWAFARTLGLYQDSAARGSIPDLDGADDYYAEVLGSRAADEEEGGEEHPEFAALRASKRLDPLVTANPDQIDELVTWGEGYEHRPDSRLQALRTFLDAVCRPGGHWSNERVVVFTEYAATLDWIERILTQQGYADRLATIQGLTPLDEREDVRARFSADPSTEPVRVLVATDAAGEGIDLQAHCHRLVNFDVPFNPSRLEQRIGRIDRYGQRHQPLVYHFAPVSTSSTYAGDIDFLRRIAERIGTVAVELGSVNQVIDADIQRRFSRTDSKARGVTPGRDDEGAAIITRTLAGGLELNRQLTELSRTYGERKLAMHLTPDNAHRVLETALALTAQPPLVEVGDDRTEARVFEVPALGPSWQPALRGLDTRLHPGVLRPVTFDDEAAAGRTDLVHVHLGHALMQKSARLLRSALFSNDAGVHRVTAVVIDELAQSCVAAVVRLVLVGRGGLRLHEEVFLAGVRLRGQAVAEAKVEELLDRALDASSRQLADRRLREQLTAEWNAPTSARTSWRDRLQLAVARRAQARQDSVTGSLQARRESDTARVREIFGAFRVNLRESRERLAREVDQQDTEMLFTDDQQAQRRRDLRGMEDRLAGLDAEEQREVTALAERYADVKPHVATAAVVFALTPADAAAGKLS